MKQEKTSAFSNGLIWFGAAVSIAEILTGTLIAPLGIGKGIFAIIFGHIIGCLLLYFAGLIGGLTEKSAMETVKISFGQKGSLLFSSLNVIQLVGWTAVMIVSSAFAANSVAPIGNWFWSIIIGALIIIWILVGFKNLSKINMIAMGLLFILAIILCKVIFKGASSSSIEGTISFGAAVELSAVMPISWLPLISDYTRTAKKPRLATATSALVYFFVSSWMYVIGMGAAIFTGQSDIATIMAKAGLGIAAIFIVVFSTVTTTFLDAYSAGVSCESISKRLKEKPMAVFITIIGTVLAIFTPVTQFESFLYFIGSVFAPMIAILITDFFLLKKDNTSQNFNLSNLILWLFGFILYRIFMQIDTPVGNTLPVMVITAIICLVINKMFGGKRNAKEST